MRQTALRDLRAATTAFSAVKIAASDMTKNIDCLTLDAERVDGKTTVYSCVFARQLATVPTTELSAI